VSIYIVTPLLAGEYQRQVAELVYPDENSAWMHAAANRPSSLWLAEDMDSTTATHIQNFPIISEGAVLADPWLLEAPWVGARFAGDPFADELDLDQ
jgi:hypothetical protein